MAKFPRGEDSLVALAEKFLKAMREAGDEFGVPPISADQLEQLIGTFKEDRAGALEGTALKRERHARKDKSQEALAEGLNVLIRHGQIVYRDAPEKMSRFGWGPKRSRAALEAPGEIHSLAIVAEGENWVTLRWQQPSQGGESAVYQVQRKRAEGPWEDVGIARETEHRLVDQPRGIQLSFRVVPVNKAGFGPANAMVQAVL